MWSYSLYCDEFEAACTTDFNMVVPALLHSIDDWIPGELPAAAAHKDVPQQQQQPYARGAGDHELGERGPAAGARDDVLVRAGGQPKRGGDGGDVHEPNERPR